MGQHDPEFAALEPKRAKELELLINQAAQNKAVLVVDPDQGIQGMRPVDSLGADTNVNGLVRFNRHYRRPRLE